MGLDRQIQFLGAVLREKTAKKKTPTEFRYSRLIRLASTLATKKQQLR
jgi:hypothetical protein